MEEKNIIHTVQREKANWIGSIFSRVCLLKHFIEVKIEGKRRQGRIHHQLLDDLKENKIYQNLREAAIDHTRWRTGL
jgi:hypothetical protein